MSLTSLQCFDIGTFPSIVSGTCWVPLYWKCISLYSGEFLELGFLLSVSLISLPEIPTFFFFFKLLQLLDWYCRFLFYSYFPSLSLCFSSCGDILNFIFQDFHGVFMSVLMFQFPRALFTVWTFLFYNILFFYSWIQYLPLGFWRY